MMQNPTHLAGHTECDVTAAATPVQHGYQHSFDAATCWVAVHMGAVR